MSDFSYEDLDLTNTKAETDNPYINKEGQFICKITKAEVSAVSTGKGSAAFITFEDTNGAGITKDNINIKHTSPEAQEIGRGRLKALLIAANHPNPDKPGKIGWLVGKLVGVRTERSDPYKDKKTGEEKKGLIKPRQAGAYFKVDGSVAPTNGSASAAGSAGGKNLDDEIPF